MKFKANHLQTDFIFIILLLILPSKDLIAGAWPQQKGTGYYKADFRYLSAKKIYTSDGEKVAIPDFTNMTVGVAGFYGFTDNLTFILNATVYNSVKLDSSVAEFGSDNDVQGFGDIIVGVKYGLAKFGKSIISAKLLLNLPTGISSPDGGLWTGYGDYYQTIGLEYGYSLWPITGYLNAAVAYSNHTQGFSDLFNYGIEGGYTFIKNLSLILRLHGQLSIDNGNPDVLGGFGVFSNNQQFIAYNIALAYKFTNNFGVKGYYEGGGAGKNIISAPVFNVGVFFTN
jgi:hypothetical protein